MRKVDKRRKSEMFRTVDDNRRNDKYMSNPHNIYKKMPAKNEPQRSRRDSRNKVLIYKKKKAAAELAARKLHKPRAVSHLKERKAS